MPSRDPEIKVRRVITLRKSRSTISKRVTDRGRAALKLRGLITSRKDRISAAFRKRFADELRDGEAGHDHSPGLDLVARSVMTAYQKLEAADTLYAGKAADRQKVERVLTWVAGDEVYPEVVAVRKQLDWIFGRRDSSLIHQIKGKTRRKPARLYQQLVKLVVRLRDEHLVLPLPKRPGTIDREVWLGQLEPGYQKLTKMLERVQKLAMRENYLRQARDIEIEDFDALFADAEVYVRGVFRMAGKTDKEVDRVLLTDIERRRLRREARGEREARADGLRPPEDLLDPNDEDPDDGVSHGAA